jgi:hypothetical protein
MSTDQATSHRVNQIPTTTAGACARTTFCRLPANAFAQAPRPPNQHRHSHPTTRWPHFRTASPLAGEQLLGGLLETFAVTFAALLTLAVRQPWLGAHERSFRQGPPGAGR